MNKAELIDAVAKKTGKSKKEVKEIIDGTLKTIVTAVVNKEGVSLIGFGTFRSVERAAREGRNPATGKPIHIPAATVPKFIVGKAFKDAVQK